MSHDGVLRYALIPPQLAEGEYFSAWLYTTARQVLAEAATDPGWQPVALRPADHHDGAVWFACIADLHDQPDDHNAEAVAFTTPTAAHRETDTANRHCSATGCRPCWTTVTVHPLIGPGVPS